MLGCVSLHDRSRGLEHDETLGGKPGAVGVRAGREIMGGKNVERPGGHNLRVPLAPAAYARLKELAAVTGRPPGQVAAEFLREWLVSPTPRLRPRARGAVVGQVEFPD